MKMNTSLNIAVIPLAIRWANRNANFAAVEEAFAHLRHGTDLAVLPELFSTGFIPDLDVLSREAEPSDGPAMQLIARLAARHRVAIAGSFLARDAADPAAIFNRAFLMEPSGEVTFYDKRHLFSLSPESTLLRGGSAHIPVVRFRGWNIALAVCYDLRFPVWCRNTSMAYDIILFPSNWPQSRAYAFEHLLIARAIENQAWVVGADCSGTDDFGCYDGMSLIADHEGRVVARSTADAPTDIVYATADRNALTTWRNRLPVWRAADEFQIKY
ncbi:MAG: nitrilase family protein [Muribaculaceae bacterium]|nr:nitrilase family protein [Muribaculaceae bacterium]